MNTAPMQKNNMMDIELKRRELRKRGLKLFFVFLFILSIIIISQSLFSLDYPAILPLIIILLLIIGFILYKFSFKDIVTTVIGSLFLFSMSFFSLLYWGWGFTFLDIIKVMIIAIMDVMGFIVFFKSIRLLSMAHALKQKSKQKFLSKKIPIKLIIATFFIAPFAILLFVEIGLLFEGEILLGLGFFIIFIIGPMTLRYYFLRKKKNNQKRETETE